MKKVLFTLFVLMGTMLMVSCGNRNAKATEVEATEEVTLEMLDSLPHGCGVVEEVADTTQVQEVADSQSE